MPPSLSWIRPPSRQNVNPTTPTVVVACGGKEATHDHDGEGRAPPQRRGGEPSGRRRGGELRYLARRELPWGVRCRCPGEPSLPVGCLKRETEREAPKERCDLLPPRLPPRKSLPSPRRSPSLPPCLPPRTSLLLNAAAAAGGGGDERTPVFLRTCGLGGSGDERTRHWRRQADAASSAAATGEHGGGGDERTRPRRGSC
uniref:Uncharacterized protein n=1 Tax=Oryza sativa subsp. japonica TaxID=39947 RepID=Q688M4_ORYSJ|nr:hypothetical protein [Oryza sativa Japonica Group]